MASKSGSIMGKIFGIIIVVGVSIGAWYVYSAPEFEREKPTISSKSEIYWNRVSPLKIKVEDNVALKNYKVELSDGTNTVIVAENVFEKPSKKEVIEIKYPKGKVLDNKAKEFKLKAPRTFFLLA